MASKPLSPRLRPRLEGLEARIVLSTLPANFSETSVAKGLTSPTAMEIAPDGRIWVLEQGGTVEVFHDGSTTGAKALTIPAASINSEGEHGLLGIAFDPSYDINSPAPDYVYLYYTSTSSPNPHNRISRFTVDNSNPDKPTLSAEKVLVDLDPLIATIHNGGAIHFGPDGKLYVGVGDNGRSDNAQSLTTRLGKILRYNADGSIPSDNPTTFPGIAGSTSGVDRAIYAVGLRNPYTFAFQPGTGVLYINDVGLSSFEEIDVGKSGANYGWPTTEGTFDQAAFPNFTEPLYDYAHGTGTFEGFAITGGAFYNPSSPGAARFPASYDGDYFFADVQSGWIHVIDPATKAVNQFASAVPAPVDLKLEADGSLLYLARVSDTVQRIVFDGNQAPAITTQPHDEGTIRGDAATFTVVATGTAPLAYQWQRADAGASAFLAIPGATSASYTLADPLLTDDGARFRVVVTNASGSLVSDPATLAVAAGPLRTAPASFDGLGRTDVATYLPSLGSFAYRPSGGGADVIIPFGIPGAGQTIPAAADYEGTGRTNIAAYLPSLGAYAIRPSSGPDQVFPFGIAGAGQSIPTPADFDGDGKADVAVYMPSIASFGYRPSGGGPDVIVPFGFAGAGQTIPAPADYTGDGKVDIAAYLPLIGAFAVRPSEGGPDEIIPFGPSGAGQSIPIPGDYDGSGHAELAIYIPAQGIFAYRPAGGGPDVIVPFGTPGEGSIPIPGDYTGSGRTEIALYNPTFATFAYRPTIGDDVIVPFGIPGAGQSLPVAAPAGSVISTVSAASVATAKAALATARSAAVPGGPLRSLAIRRATLAPVPQGVTPGAST